MMMSFQYIRNAVKEAKIELKESFNEITENVSDQGQINVCLLFLLDFNHFYTSIVDGLVQDLKDVLMTKEMQDAFNTIEFVLGKLNTLSLIAIKFLVVVQHEGFTLINYTYFNICQSALNNCFGLKIN